MRTQSLAGKASCSRSICPGICVRPRPVPFNQANWCQQGDRLVLSDTVANSSRSSSSRSGTTSSSCSSSSSSSSSTRRNLLAGFTAATILSRQLPAQAEEQQQPSAEPAASLPKPAPRGADSSTSGDKVYLDVRIDGEPAGRIVIALLPDVTAGSTRFRELAVGGKGVDYKRSKFNGVYPTFIENDGVKNLSYSATEASPITGGDSIQLLEEELARQTRSHTGPGIVSLIVGETEERPIQEKLVAYGGQFRTIKIQAGEAPNGTGFTITTAANQELDRTHLVVGRVIEGMDVITRVSALPINKPRDDNPYFRLGKAMGDKRAVTAEAGFYRPFKKVVVSASGLA